MAIFTGSDFRAWRAWQELVEKKIIGTRAQEKGADCWKHRAFLGGQGRELKKTGTGNCKTGSESRHGTRHRPRK